MSEQNPGGAVEVDLFGNPIEPLRERRGRPCYRKDPENQLLVASLVAAGWRQERIAEAMGCDPKTLRKHFSRELAAGADLLEMQAIQVAVSKMRQGHTPSVKLVLDLIEKGKAEGIRSRRAGEKQDPAPPPPGKKEQAQLDAKAALEGGTWGDLTKPH